MDTIAKRSLTSLKEDTFFIGLVKKITLKETLSNEEWSYILSCSLVLIKEYQETRNDGFFQFAYYLIMSYSFATKDWMPLYHFSINSGFYPISDCLYGKLENQRKIDDEVIHSFLDDYKINDITLIKDQKEKIDDLCKSTSNYRAFIAPTSYGKSDFIKRDIELHKESKIGIIVPTKALIWQTFNSLKVVAKKNKLRIIIHDTEYGGEKAFIGIFTQERAIRLIQDNNVYFDILYIDEAHNVFDYDDRQILLTRLIRLNKKGNQNQRLVFLSPLIKDVKNLSFKDDSFLADEQRINKSIKDFDIHYLMKNGCCYAYNRFVDYLWDKNIRYSNPTDYIVHESKNKNLLFCRRPMEVERIAEHVSNELTVIEDERLIEISKLLKSYSHDDYLLAKTIEKGLIYIHSKIPDFIKDYLYSCFIKEPSIKYLVSNNCVLEGVNFPIESLFILNAYGLNENSLINLTGRVNRLNYIFGKENVDLKKLLCPIHFVEDPKQKAGMYDKMTKMRADIKDVVENPILENAVVTPDRKEKAAKIVEVENDFLQSSNSVELKYILIKNGIDKKYKDFDSAFLEMQKRIDVLKGNTGGRHILLILKECFIDNMTFSPEANVLYRLQQLPTVNYYIRYLDETYHSSLKAKIAFILRSFSSTLEAAYRKYTYIGKSFGTEKWTEEDSFPTYVDLTKLNKAQLANLAIVKSKIEDDFIDFELMPFVKALFDYGIISEDDYNEFAYGSNDANIISLYKAGFSSTLIKFISDNNLLNEIENCGYGFKITDRFKEAMYQQDELIIFELSKYLV